MRLLLLGGPRFLGYAIIESALSRGHELTLFNRGKTGAGEFPHVERLTGDRDGGLDVLRGREWDAVIDTCGYFPRIVRDSARFLKDSVDHYTFVSSISVYASPYTPPYDEHMAVSVIDDPTMEEITNESYGALKALCEQAVEEEMPARTLQIRPGLIIGPRDPSDRFTYWPVRVARGGPILAPGKPDDPIQVIDVRDLAEWMLNMAEARKTGVYNATSPEMRLEDVLNACVPPDDKKDDLVWVPEDFLLANEVTPWMELPLWLTGEDQLTFKVSVEKALQDGLRLRPLRETAADTLTWAQLRETGHPWRAGMDAEREAELLRKWAGAADA